MFPEDVNLNILSFLGILPRKRCWARTKSKYRCKKKVQNHNYHIFCPTHKSIRFQLPLYKPYEDISYIIEKIGKYPTHHEHSIYTCPPPPSPISQNPYFPYI